MSYTIYLFRKEVKEKNTTLEFLENDKLVTKFSDEQFLSLKKRLGIYGFEIESDQKDTVSFRFKDKALAIQALLTKSQLSFSSGFSEEAIFEISMTASEFTDSGDYVVFDLQEGAWE